MKEDTYKKSWEELPQKFFRDEDGNYWECTANFDGKNFMVPAPVWAGNINFYLFEGPNIFIEPTRKPLCDVPIMRSGGKPADGGNLILTDEEKEELLRTDPKAEQFLRPYMMGVDFINRITRWCLWLKGVEPADIRQCPRVLERIEKVREFRSKSKKESTRKKADTPMLFDEPIECATNYLVVPGVSSSTRKYIPIGWITPDVIPGNALRFIPNATLYHFGVLNSSVHMAWVRKISGRLKSDYSYSNTLDYNAFPWPRLYPTPWLPDGNPHLRAIETTAQEILDARAKYPRSSLADLYDERTMPPELRKAHQHNDDAVMSAYGFERHYQDDKWHDEDIAIRLMYMYQELTGCREYYEDYPNLALYERFYGPYGDEYEDEDDGTAEL